MIAAAVAANAGQEGQTVSSKIVESTVFFNQARITRHASARVDSGIHRLVLPIKAFSMDRNSVTAEIKGKGELLGVRTTRIPVLEPRQEKIRDLENKKDQLLLQKRAIEDRIASIEKQQKFLDSVAEFSEIQVPADIRTRMPSKQDFDNILKFLGNRYSAILDKKRAADTEAERLEKEIKKIRRELDMLRGRTDKIAIGIEIMFRSEEPQDIDIKTRYLVENAGWSPVYRAMADDAGSRIKLSMMAEIKQKTGEDWKNSTVSVSTMVPVKAGRLPDLSTWYIDTRGIRRSKTAESRRPQMEKFAAAPEKKQTAGMAEAEKRQTAISFEYTMPEPATIESGEGKTLLPVFTKSIDGDFRYHAVPKLDSKAWLTCEAEADRELLAGPVSIFFAGRYTGDIFLEEKQPGQPFVLGLGPDRSVSVKRKKTKDQRKETTFFGKIEKESIARKIAYRIDAENLKQRPVKIHILDNIPVSKTDRIKVKDVAFIPEPDKENINGKQGVMRWEAVLGPGESLDISISFTVAYPKDMPPPVF